MKFLKYIPILLIICAFVIPRESNAQAVSTMEEMYINAFVECANDGVGEYVAGTIILHVVMKEEGNVMFWHYQPTGGELVGEDTGTVFRATGKTAEMAINYDENGMPISNYVNLFHIVGPGIQFFVRIIAHQMYVDGEWIFVVDKYETICK